ncbi:MAG: FAD-dependent oxidoreductase [Clostridiales bacterium]|nr:FAD-dependent oxidoreductase [Clostridiales bacterium]MDD7433078.1 FAD-dependent oxidoreductase [Clostridiales bacterium]MDY3061793.1 FAD-dependent oxidoreductase [Eubacteriales bacterium]
MNRYVIVGGVAAGATAAARLRRLDEKAEILLIERGPYVSYANCGLPYYIGGKIPNRQSLFVATKESITAKYKIDIHENTEVIDLDPQARTVSMKNLKTGEISEKKYTSLLLSTGSSPIVPPFPGVEGSRVFTLWTVPDTDKIKSFVTEHEVKRALVVGGGFIGLEMVENLMGLGIQVEVAEMAPQVMAPLDPDMSKIVENHLEDQGVHLHLGKGLTRIEEDGQRAVLSDGTAIDVDMILLSIGIRPNQELSRKAGLEMDQRGHVLVDERMRSSVPGIYAAGDLVAVRQFATDEKVCIALAGPANKQGRIAADNMVLEQMDEKQRVAEKNRVDKQRGAEKRYLYLGSQGTSVAKIFDLTVASTGQNEKQLKARGQSFRKDYAYSLIHPQAHAGYYPGALPMVIKLLFSLYDGQILGAQIVGYAGVDKRIDVLATALRLGANVYDLLHLELAYAPPYSSAKDPVNMAAYVATNIFDGLTDPVTWEEALEFSRDSSSGHQLLDIRETVETEAFALEGVKQIPLSELRARLGELDAGTTYDCFCAVGLRGYLAERILKQHGFKAENILGGVRSYQTMQGHASRASSRDAALLPAEAVAASAASVRAAGSADALEAIPEKLELLNVCGLSCPGPIVEVAKKLKDLQPGQRIRVTATDPGFARDISSWCQNTGNILLKQGKEGESWFADLQKGGGTVSTSSAQQAPAPGPLSSPSAGTAPQATAVKEKTMIVFDGDLDKAIAAFIIANGAAAMGNKVNMFFTFWGLNVIRKPEKMPVKKEGMAKMFSAMMPRGSKKLGLSKMNFCGMGPRMIRSVMKSKNISSLEELIHQAQEAGVKMTACQMSMDVMGITKEELLDGVEVGGVATMLNDSDRSNMNLFI